MFDRRYKIPLILQLLLIFKNSQSRLNCTKKKSTVNNLNFINKLQVTNYVKILDAIQYFDGTFQQG